MTKPALPDSKRNQPAGTPAERIVEVASDLFYTQGYRATGINEVISKSGVAKATFYSHFKSKDDLCCEYLKCSQHQMSKKIETAITTAGSVEAKFLAPMQCLREFLGESGYRGCAFMNIASEVPDCESPLRKEGIKVYDALARQLVRLSKDLIASDPKRFAGVEPEALGRDYMMILAGAVALAELYASEWPMEQGLKTLQGLIGARQG